MSQHNVYTTYPKINTSAYSSAINDINKEVSCETTHSILGTTYVHRGEKETRRTKRGGAAIRDKESCKDFKPRQHRHNSIDLNNVQHREQDRDKYKMVCKLEQTTGQTDDSDFKKRPLSFGFVI
ncbi:hypothetical protein PAMP_024405 [Pampus punctatissimus]